MISLHWPRAIHANVAAAAPRNPGFLTVISPGSHGYALYPSAQVFIAWGTNDRSLTNLLGRIDLGSKWFLSCMEPKVRAVSDGFENTLHTPIRVCHRRHPDWHMRPETVLASYVLGRARIYMGVCQIHISSILQNTIWGPNTLIFSRLLGSALTLLITPATTGPGPQY